MVLGLAWLRRRREKEQILGALAGEASENRICRTAVPDLAKPRYARVYTAVVANFVTKPGE